MLFAEQEAAFALREVTEHHLMNVSMVQVLDPSGRAARTVALAREELLRHIGIATATEEGLLVPVIKDADKNDLWEIARELARLTEAARARTIGHDDLRGRTFTISNYGACGMGASWCANSWASRSASTTGRWMEKGRGDSSAR